MYAQQYLQEVAYILGCVELDRACSWRLVDLYREGQTAKQRKEDKKHVSVIIKNLMVFYFNHLYEICKLLGGLQPLAVGHLGIVKPLGIHRVELHNQMCTVSSNGIILYSQYI